MATTDRTRPTEEAPADLLPLLRRSGVLTERQFNDVRDKVRAGSYPDDAFQLANRLVREGLLTDYQAKKLLSGRAGGMVVGKYVILDRLGSGAMGRVYKAHHQLMGRVVALKIIAPEISSNSRVVARFQREMKLVGRLDHPNVVRAFDADSVSNLLYIVMEYVAGESLGARFKDRGPLPAMDVINYAAHAARGLAHAHGQGIVHRDVKPSNLLLSESGQVKVLDLGLGVLMEADEANSFATADGVAVGTIDYMSPEQACGKDVDGKSDLYSLGCAMHHLISGRLPFPGDSPVDRLGKRISGKPQPLSDLVPNLPRGLTDVMDRLLANKSFERYATADEAADALEALLPGRKGASSAARSAAAVAVPEPRVIEREVEVEVEVEPDYPGWFQPLARLTSRSPGLGLLVALSALGLTFAAGMLAGLLLR